MRNRNIEGCVALILLGSLAIVGACTVKSGDGAAGAAGAAGVAGEVGGTAGNSTVDDTEARPPAPAQATWVRLETKIQTAGSAGESAAAGSSGAGGDSGGLGNSCFANLFGTYTVRTNGHAVNEAASSETIVVDYASMTDATPLAGVLSVQQQSYAACALLEGGTVSCWQQDATNGNIYGQLGQGNTDHVPVYRAVPVLKAANKPLTDVVALASGTVTNAACAITKDKRLWCWGDLSWLVNAGAQDYSNYAQVITMDGQSPLDGVLQASIGIQQACAVLEGESANSVWCWGNARGEELGQGDTVNHQYPVQVTGLSNPSKVVLVNVYNNAGGPRDTVCALDKQTVECWGGGAYNQASVPSPTQVTTSASVTLREVADIEEGIGQFAFQRADQTVWLWGPHGQASAYGVPDVLQIGWGGGDTNALRYVTSDGRYHANMTTINVDCDL